MTSSKRGRTGVRAPESPVATTLRRRSGPVYLTREYYSSSGPALGIAPRLLQQAQRIKLFAVFYKLAICQAVYDDPSHGHLFTCKRDAIDYGIHLPHWVANPQT